jgi:hypothetical protein
MADSRHEVHDAGAISAANIAALDPLLRPQNPPLILLVRWKSLARIDDGKSSSTRMEVAPVYVCESGNACPQPHPKAPRPWAGV